ncbi:hypothetical protein F8M41_023392 [Gigaspora margarita]|uniref:Uncharacterized protein n=1 Tax=Gigaspora margarita TaxID=4874 RepID=A0A8H4EH66_GIGMA|nr:hypothetical protein F8M41_023392 [Gigaspora margarita]
MSSEQLYPGYRELTSYLNEYKNKSLWSFLLRCRDAIAKNRKGFFDEAIFVKEFKTSSTICISGVEQDGDDDDDETFRSSTENLNHTLLDGLEERSPEWRRRLLKGNYFNPNHNSY